MPMFGKTIAKFLFNPFEQYKPITKKLKCRRWIAIVFGYAMWNIIGRYLPYICQDGNKPYAMEQGTIK
mgnify:CR=1 FL=1